MILQCLFLCFPVEAQIRSNLYTKPEPKVEISTGSEKASSKTSAPRSKHNSSILSGNLDSEILVVNPSYRVEDSQVILPNSPKGIRLKNLRSGDVVRAEISESLLAFPDSKVPVRARVTYGDLKGSVLLGEATLEKNSKRILVEFKKYRSAKGSDDYQVTASALDSKGILGVEGKYVNQEPKFFAAEFLAAGAAGYADASIERGQNTFGNYVEAPTADTISKKALSSTLAKTTERFAEKMKSAPEYSILEGPFEVQILIIEQPKLIE